MMTDTDVEVWTWDAIRKTINKFRERPDFFFTESDIASYMWKCLYTSKLEVEAHGRKIFCVHREYPTNFRYDKKHLLEIDAPPALDERLGTRGNYDLVVLDPEFVRTTRGLDHVVNKNIRRLEERFDPSASELLFAVEFKYVISNSVAWTELIRLDNQKLLFAKQHNVRHAVNLVFCNTQHDNVKVFQQAVQEAHPSILAIFVQSHYVNSVKQSEKPLWNAGYSGQGIADMGFGP